MKKSAFHKNAKSRGKLSLDRRTVRQLSRGELHRVAGGPGGDTNTGGACTFFNCSAPVRRVGIAGAEDLAE